MLMHAYSKTEHLNSVSVRVAFELVEIHLRSYLDAGAGFGSEDSYKTES